MKYTSTHLTINGLGITKDAHPFDTKITIDTKITMEKYLSTILVELYVVKMSLFFTLLCILEDMNYNKNNEKYLRWDYRSGRKCQKGGFIKREIKKLDSAIISKIYDIIKDTKNISSARKI
ncbi:MAG: hypothetical protein NZM04_00190 [Methylacidiphilales bacterium]|nr:hypothetical protein [Candidatus Methylacidiphilales bacterium]